MRQSTEPKYRKCVKSYCFLSFARIFGEKYAKNLKDTATETEIDSTKTVPKRVVQKTAVPTGDLIGNKTADKITSAGKTTSKKKKMKQIKDKKFTYHPKKDSELLMIKIVLGIV